MSLVYHVSVIEGTDRIEAPDREPSIHAGVEGVDRRLSYNPLAQPEDTQAIANAAGVGAHFISKRMRIAHITVGVISCVLASGITYGFAALKPELIDERVYQYLCGDTAPDPILSGACYVQDLRLNLLFTFASLITNVAALPAGIILDWYGPKVASVIGCLFLLLGTAITAIAHYVPFDAWLLGYVSLALGGTFTFVPAFHLSNAFPAQAGTILALITGAFDASAFVFFIFRVLYSRIPGLTTSRFFAIYTLVPVVMLIAQLTIMPSKTYNTFTELEKVVEEIADPAYDAHDSDDELDSIVEVRKVQWKRHERRMGTLRKLKKVLGSAEEREEHKKQIAQVQKQSDVWGMLHGRSPLKQMRSRWFILITIFTVIQMARMNYFIATVRSQYEYLLGGNTEGAKWLNELFDVALPVGGLISVPFIGLILDNVPTEGVLGLLVMLSSVIGVLSCIPSIPGGIGQIFLFVLLRPLYYSAMSDYAAKVFGFATFGRVYGAIVFISGVCNVLQIALVAATHQVFHDNPTPVNIVLCVLGFVVGVLLTVYVRFRGRILRKRYDLREYAPDAEVNETTSLLGGASRRESRIER